MSNQLMFTNAQNANQIELDRNRRQEILRLGLIICMILIFMDGGARTTDAQRSSKKLQNVVVNETHKPVELYNSIINGDRILSDRKYPSNVTGMYFGTWTSGVRNQSRLEGKFTVQLKSVNIQGISGMDFVYGLAKFFSSDSVAFDFFYPIQGLYLRSSGGLFLFSSIYKSQCLYLEILKGTSEEEQQSTVESPGSMQFNISPWAGENGFDSHTAFQHGEDNSPSPSLSSSRHLRRSNSRRHGAPTGRNLAAVAADTAPDGSANTSVTLSRMASRTPAAFENYVDIGLGLRLHLVDSINMWGSGVNFSSSGSLGVPDYSAMMLLDVDLLPQTVKNYQIDKPIPFDVEASPAQFPLALVLIFPHLPMWVLGTRYSVGEGLTASVAGSAAKSCQQFLAVLTPSFISLAATPVGAHADPAVNFSASQHMDSVLPSATTTSESIPQRRESDGNKPELFSQIEHEGELVPLRRLQSIHPFSSSPSPASRLDGKIFSSCGSLNISVASFYAEHEIVEKKAATYSLLATAICFLQIGLLILQLKFAQNQAASAKISITTMCGQALLDAVLSVLHMLVSAATTKVLYFTYLAMVAMLKLVLFGIFEMKVMLMVYQARYSQDFADESANGLRRRIAALNLRFFIIFFILLMFIFYFRTRPTLIVIALYSYWVPQILYSAYTGTRRAFHPLYLFGTAISRLIIPLYFLGCPANFISAIMPADSVFSMRAHIACVVLVLWTALQLTMLYLQDLYGGRFFIPITFIPRRYDYFREYRRLCISESVEVVRGGAGRDVDMCSLTASQEADVENGDLPECSVCHDRIELEKGTYMVTPCDHVYHKDCLSQWLNVKLECPVCRSSLPSMDD